jgi:hypothetical protein
MRLLALHSVLAFALGVLGSSGPAAAEAPEVRRHGAACPPTGCAPARGSSATASLGFGTAVLVTGLIARRRAAASR